MDNKFWLEIGIFLLSQLCVAIGIIYNRGKSDQSSIGRFKANEIRIEHVEFDIVAIKLDMKALMKAFMESSVLMARIDERTTHMVESDKRIEAQLTTITKRNVEVDK